MTSRKGCRKPKKTVVVADPEEPELIINCICPHCNASFMPQMMTGEYPQGKCPKCDRPIKGVQYDALALKTLEEIERTSLELKEVGEISKKWERRKKFLSFIPIPFVQRWVGRKIEETRKESSRIYKKIGTGNKHLRALAIMRYYTSGFYRRTHYPLERKVVRPFKINPFYTSQGKWIMPFGKGGNTGLIAEFMVFDALEKKVSDPESVLYQAQIIPNLYLPKDDIPGKSHWNQVDCILLTRQAAFVLEIKRRHQHVIANAPFNKIYSVFDDDEFESLKSECDIANDQELKSRGVNDSSSFALKQNSIHAVAFSAICDMCPFEKVFEQTVFVGTKSFHSDQNAFVDNVGVAALLEEGEDFIEMIEKACMSLQNHLTQDQIDELAEGLINKYGDLNQKRWIIHDDRIRNK